MRKWQFQFDLNEPLFTHAELCTVAGLSPGTAAKWLHRDIIEPTRRGSSRRGGHLYSAMKIFEVKTTSALVSYLSIPPTESGRIAMRIANDWTSIGSNDPKRWPLFFLITRTDDSWECDPLLGWPKASEIEEPVFAIFTAARVFWNVYEQCWTFYSGRADIK